MVALELVFGGVRVRCPHAVIARTVRADGGMQCGRTRNEHEQTLRIQLFHGSAGPAHPPAMGDSRVNTTRRNQTVAGAHLASDYRQRTAGPLGYRTP